jgi:hypothetical protein
MTIYQVVNEENQVYSEYTAYDQALYTAQDFTVWDEEHYYHVEELELQVA